MPILQVSLLVILCLSLIYSTSLIVSSLKTIAIRYHLSSYGLTAFILAISTSLPELMVGIVASIEGNATLVLGNVIGSNIADLSLVIGGAAIIGGALRVDGSILNRDLYLTGGASILPIFLILDHTLSRSDGLVLLVIYIIFVTTVLRPHHTHLARNALSTSHIKRLFLLVTHAKSQKSIIKFILGVIILLISSHFIVQLANLLASNSGLSPLFIGLFLVSVGTSLPELAFEWRAVSTGHTNMAMGDLLGSIVANSTLILGLAAVFRPLTLTNKGLIPYSLAIIVFVVMYIAFTIFVKSKRRLDWWEGLILILMFFIFLFFENNNILF